MATIKAGRGRFWVLVIGVSACIAWLAWAWSPKLEDMPAASEAVEPAALAPSAVPAQVEPVAQAAAAPALPSKPQVEARATVPDAATPERVPTPHPMSLDQAKPPQSYGELAELKKQYESESRSDKSSQTEAGLRALISTPNIPAELVQDIACRRNLCKIEAHWTPRRRLGFSVLLESFKNLYSQRVAVEPATGPAADGSYVTTLYMRLTQ